MCLLHSQASSGFRIGSKPNNVTIHGDRVEDLPSPTGCSRSPVQSMVRQSDWFVRYRRASRLNSQNRALLGVSLVQRNWECHIRNSIACQALNPNSIARSVRISGRSCRIRILLRTKGCWLGSEYKNDRTAWLRGVPVHGTGILKSYPPMAARLRPLVLRIRSNGSQVVLCRLACLLL